MKKLTGIAFILAVFLAGVLVGRWMYRPRARLVVGRSVPFDRFQIYAKPGDRVCGLEKDATISLNNGHTWEECAKLAVAMQGLSSEIPGIPRAPLTIRSLQWMV